MPGVHVHQVHPLATPVNQFSCFFGYKTDKFYLFAGHVYNKNYTKTDGVEISANIAIIIIRLKTCVLTVKRSTFATITSYNYRLNKNQMTQQPLLYVLLKNKKTTFAESLLYLAI